ncbi:MAG: HEAT repeat domain-containing protein, partial [Vicinamibacteria bacterium]
RRQVDLTVKQVQADLSFENDFRLPVDVEIVAAAGRATHTVTLEGWTTRTSLPAETKPLAVVFDKGNWLVSELRFERPLAERLHLLGHGDVGDQLRATRQIVQEHPRQPEAALALARLLADPKTHWGVRQEAAVALGTIGGDAAATALAAAAKDADPRVRRAVATGLGIAGGDRSAVVLRALAQGDAAEDVVGTAAVSLGRIHAPGARDFLKAQLARDSRWYEEIRTGVVKGLAELEDPTLATVFASYLDPRYPRQLRQAALEGWFRAAPTDPALVLRLRELTGDRNRTLREEALTKLGLLHRATDAPFLRDLAKTEVDPTLAEEARAAADEIDAFIPKP